MGLLKKILFTLFLMGGLVAGALEHGDLGGTQLGGELGRRRALQEKYLFRYQAGNLRGNEGFLDFQSDLIGYFTNRLPRAGSGKVVLCEFAGVGMALDAAVAYAYSTQDPDVLAEKDRWIDLIIGSQDDDGYFGMIQREENDIWLFRGWIIHDGVYLCIALMDNYELFGHKPSLEAAQRFMDFVMARWRHGTGCSPVGITEALHRLYELTGDEKYLHDFADVAFDGRFIEEEPVRDWKQRLYPIDNSIEPPERRKVHTYRYFARCIAQLDLAAIQPDAQLEKMTDYTLCKMEDERHPGLFISGATGRTEGWVEDQDGRGGVGEACAVVHQIWLLDRLIEQRGDLSYGDLMERMVLNHMCAAQNAVDGRSRYFTSLSGVRSYDKGAHCCEGNTRRFWAELPQQVFYTGSNTVAVNLFTPAKLTTTLGGTELILEQTTDYPADGIINLRIDPRSPIRFGLELRIPRWALAHRLEVNGVSVPAETISGGVRVSRVWKSGDTVRLELPMAWRWVKGVGYYKNRYALMRGPQVFCASRDWNPNLEGIGLSAVALDPATLEPMAPRGGTAARHGQMARVRGRLPSGKEVGVVLTDFPEENGEETYFPLTDPSVAVEDELLRAVDLNPYLEWMDVPNGHVVASDDFAGGVAGESLSGRATTLGGLSWVVSGPGCQLNGEGGATFVDGQSTAHGHVVASSDPPMLRIVADVCPADPAAFAAGGRINLGMGQGYHRGYWAETGRDTLSVCMGPLSGGIRLRAFDAGTKEQRLSAWAALPGFVPETDTPQDYRLTLGYNRDANRLSATLSNKVTGAVVSNALDTTGMALSPDAFGFELTGVQASAAKPHIDRFELEAGAGE